MPVIELRDVAFAYPGRRSENALHGVTFTIQAGVTGLIGPNGAGKTTLLRLIAGILLPSHGSLTINGASADTYRRKGGTGLIPETPRFDGYLRVGEFLNGLAGMLGVRHSLASSLSELWHSRLSTLSLGQKRKVELAAAFLGRPDVILLDEPTNGLDPFSVIELRKQIFASNSGQRTLVISSHHLDELQRTVDHLVLLEHGRCRGCWSREEAIKEYGSLEALFEATFTSSAAGGLS